jgi:hypothetical protein
MQRMQKMQGGVVPLLALGALVLAAAVAAAPQPSHKFPTPGAPAFPFAYRGWLWVAAHRGGEIYKINPKTNRIVHTYQTGESACFAQGSGGKVTYFTCDGPGGVVIDVRTGKMRRFAKARFTSNPVEGVTYWGGLKYAGSDWIRTTRGVFERIDPKTHVVLKRWHGTQGEGTSNVADGSIWFGGNTVVTRVDPHDDTLTIIPLPGARSEPGPNQGYAELERLAVTPGAIWAPNPAGLYRIDEGTNTAKLVPGIRVGNLDEWGYIDIVAARGSLFMRNSPTQVVRIDPKSGSITAQYPASGGGGGIAVAYGSLWVTNFINDRTWRIPLGG